VEFFSVGQLLNTLAAMMSLSACPQHVIPAIKNQIQTAHFNSFFHINHGYINKFVDYAHTK